MTIKELRCSECNKLMAKYSEPNGELEIKCSRCKKTNSFMTLGEDTKWISVYGAKVIKPRDIK